MIDEKSRKPKSDDERARDAIVEIASSVANSTDTLVAGAIAGVVVGGTLYAGYHATKFTVKQARKQSKHVKAGAEEVIKQAESLASGADAVANTVRKQAAQITGQVTRRRKKKDEPEDFPRL